MNEDKEKLKVGDNITFYLEPSCPQYNEQTRYQKLAGRIYKIRSIVEDKDGNELLYELYDIELNRLSAQLIKGIGKKEKKGKEFTIASINMKLGYNINISSILDDLDLIEEKLK